jgi:hypothetical protein
MNHIENNLAGETVDSDASELGVPTLRRPGGPGRPAGGPCSHWPPWQPQLAAASLSPLASQAQPEAQPPRHRDSGVTDSMMAVARPGARAPGESESESAGLQVRSNLKFGHGPDSDCQ